VLLTTTIYDSFAYFITPSPVSSLSLFFLLILPPPRSTLFPYTTLFRSALGDCETVGELVERNGRSRLELACGHAGVSELRRERRSEEHTSELQSPYDLVCRLLLEKKKKKESNIYSLN